MTEPATIIRYRFEEAKWVNRVAFEISNVPCKFTMHHLDPTTSTMVATTDRTGQPISGTVNLPEPGTDYSRWQSLGLAELSQFKPYDFLTPPILTTQIELRIDRNVAIYLNDTTRNYSIAIRNVDMVLESNGDRRVFPPVQNETVTIRDPLGHIERLTLDDWEATRAVDGDLNTFWKCEPQPVGDAVVPFYMDVRTADGEPQLVDRLWLDPVYTGPAMNVYYSNDDTQPSVFSVSNKLLTMDVVGNADPDGTGAPFAAAGDALKITTNEMLMDLTKDWSVGITWRPNNNDEVATGRRVLWELDTSTQLIAVAWDPTAATFKIQRNGAAILAQVAAPFDAGDTVSVVASREQGVGWSIHVAVDGGAVASASSADLTSDTDYLQQFFVGSNVALTAPARGYLQDVWAKQEVPSIAAIDAYVSNPRYFMLRIGPFDRTRGDYNAVLLGRLENDATVYVGPSDTAYDQKIWTPVYRDFRLQKGIVELPPTFCKYIKLEFTQLAARPYPLWEGGIERVVRDYPQWVHKWYGEIEKRTREIVSQRAVTTYGSYSVATDFGPNDVRIVEITKASGSTETWWTGATVASGILGKQSVRYEGGPTLAFDPSQYGQYSARIINQPTMEVAFASTSYVPETSTLVEDLYSLYQRKFYRVIRHEYQMRTVKTTWQQAYFVGLREVKAFRLDYTAINDDAEYVETFEDDAMVDTMTLTRDPATSRVYSTAVDDLFESNVIESHSDFKTLQLAAMSSLYEPLLSDSQMHLDTVTHISALTSTSMTDVTSAVSGDGNGKVYEVLPTSGGPQTYGIKTNTGIINAETDAAYDHVSQYDTETSYDAAYVSDPENLRMAVVARFYLPISAQGTYRIRLYTGATPVAQKTVTDLVSRKWIEIELPYLASSSAVDLQAELAQIDTAVSEPFDVDFLGVFQNPLHWEVSNDAGTNWHSVHTGINNPNYFVTLPTPGNELKVRVTARRPGAWIQKFAVVPHYINSPYRPGPYRQAIEQSAHNEADCNRAVVDRPLFKMWDRLLPPHYSLQRARTIVV